MRDAKLTGRGEMAVYFGVSAFLIFIGFLFGWLEPTKFAHQLEPMLRSLMKSAQQFKSSGNWLHMFGFIFFHNALTALELAVFGLVIGLFPAYMMWLNGLMIGYAVTMVGSLHPGVSAWRTIVFGLLPHGVFELTAIFWASALGIANGLAVLRALRNLFKPPNVSASVTRAHSEAVLHPLRYALARTARTLPVIWGILLIAALIEAGITPHLMAWGIPGVK